MSNEVEATGEAIRKPTHNQAKTWRANESASRDDRESEGVAKLRRSETSEEQRSDSQTNPPQGQSLARELKRKARGETIERAEA